MGADVRVTRILLATALIAAAVPVAAEDNDRVVTIDHYVRLKSEVPSMQGQPAQVYVRERVKAGIGLRGAARGTNRVVLFVHGRGTPAEVAFDVPHQGYSWMGYLADAGFDVFSVSVAGYGRSYRPALMSDPCNLAADVQAQFIPSLIPAACAPAHKHAATTLASDWAEIGAAVDYIRSLRGVDRVSLVGWSLGGPRAAGYAAQFPQKVHRIVLLAPAYSRTASAVAPKPLPESAAYDTQSRAEFDANWNRQIGCPNQVEPAVADSVWRAMLDSDPIGATWGPGVRRAPFTTSFGWTQAVVTKTQTPILIVTGPHDRQVPAERGRELYEDLGAKEKVLVDLACTSHNAMWETNRLLLFGASREWLDKGTVNNQSAGAIRLGY
jgi:pimeloyl-ACP methyl ester carboxylesterase